MLLYRSPHSHSHREEPDDQLDHQCSALVEWNGRLCGAEQQQSTLGLCTVDGVHGQIENIPTDGHHAGVTLCAETVVRR
jgi:hypothetical protein